MKRANRKLISIVFILSLIVLLIAITYIGSRDSETSLQVAESNFINNNDGITDANKISLDDYLDKDLGRFNQRQLDLGIDPDRGMLSVPEIETAVRIEAKSFGMLERSSIGDWKIIGGRHNGKFIDGIGPAPKDYFDLESFTKSITEGHIYKASKSNVHLFAVDMTGNTMQQIKSVEEFVRNLPQADIDKIMFIK